ncbi:MAG: recombinase family protein [Eubacteriales bacterium]|nr:recombinase family protein [Eubacteriales bacterium]
MGEVTVIKAGSGKVKRERDINGKAIKVDRIRVAAYARVSTDGDEQLGSFQSQMQYYTEKIQSNPEWVFVGVYSDEAITGTLSDKRPGFQQMIQDCLDGKIDMILTKSISRFARNTVDTLSYVRMLKDRQIGVVFEKENIDTLTMNGELLLTILSSLAQQDVETISSNVKMGLKMKMSRGELVGYHGCLGYDYDSDTKTISINEKEAEIVRMIFDMYLQGFGTYTIANHLTELGVKNRKGEVHWTDSGVRGIIKNEKYKGDLLQGKTITVDPITKRRIENFGEEDQFCMEDHHEAIISREDWDRAQEIRLSRAHNKSRAVDGKREVATRKYAFSSMCECGFCGTKLTRRTFHSNSTYQKPVWYCRTAANKGKHLCPHSKSIDESILEGAFLDSYRLLAENFDDVLDSVLSTVESVVSDNHDAKRLEQVKKDIANLESRRKKLLDMLMDGNITQEAYDEKYADFTKKIEKYIDERENLKDNVKEQKNIGKRMAEMKAAISSEDVLDEFDRLVFESIVEKVIVGGEDENGNVDPFKLTFVFKTNDLKTFNEMKARYRNFKVVS